jgi:hypothetical protein
MVDGRIKGNLFENKVCRLLSVWLVSDEYVDTKQFTVFDLPFRRASTDRMPLVGHWNGQGDILHTAAMGIVCPFCVECKSQKGWELDGILMNPKWPPWGWWDQCKKQAAKVAATPLMFFTRPHRRVYVVVDKETAQCLTLKPEHGPLLRVERPSGERVVVSAVENLLAVPKRRVRALVNAVS